MAAQVLGLEAERNRLIKVRGEIAGGTLTARGFKEAIGNNGGGQGNTGLTVSDVDRAAATAPQSGNRTGGSSFPLQPQIINGARP